MSDKVYVLGATGNIGAEVMQDLLNSGVPVTAYVRNPAKVKQHDLLTVVQGDYDDLTPFENSIGGHTRLFLLVADLGRISQLKKAIASRAYAAGVKQIVDVSSLTVSAGGRRTWIGGGHQLAEDGIIAMKNRGTFVALRPARFMTNQLWQDAHTIKSDGVIYDTVNPDERQSWISTNDIARLSAICLKDPIEKHGDIVYEMAGESITPNERAAVLSKALERPITYKQISVADRYNFIVEKVGMPHAPAFTIAAGMFKGFEDVSPGLALLLGREPETIEQWLEKNKSAFD
ncbi:NAD(P)-binding protein [Lichtheimia hyalospora FSU 10163]|nr:NAD(P)-binding protein [Lichtheimia hyalospora FSU 10163]